MKYEGDASAPDSGFVHSALIYGSDDAFMDVAVPFVEEGIDAGEPALLAVQAANVELLRSALGGEPEGVSFVPVEDWYETSARTRDKFARWTREMSGGGRVRVIGEPPWALGNEALVRDWARNESVANVAFAGLPLSFLCPYDTRELPAEIVEHGHCTHPELLRPEGPATSEPYEDPQVFCRRLNGYVGRPEGEPSETLDFNLADLSRVRRMVASSAAECGLPEARGEELALAVNELASNAVIHGRPPASLRIWRRDDELICEVSDAGEGIKDALAGQLTPPAESIGGRGIWLARMLCDAVEIRNGTGCTVTVHANCEEPAYALSS
jgi:anti-sigma regulatory factor (Ser/Thr protein kinase)